jgi:hypothetical protein
MGLPTSSGAGASVGGPAAADRTPSSNAAAADEGRSFSLPAIQQLAQGWGEGVPRRLVLEFVPLTTEPYMRTSGQRVRQAASVLDRAGALAGAALAQMPSARLGALGYILLVHLFLWGHMAMRSHCPGGLHVTHP